MCPTPTRGTTNAITVRSSVDRQMSRQPISHFGVPQIVIYLFLVWLGLIVATAWLSRAMAPDVSGKPAGPEDE